MLALPIFPVRLQTSIFGADELNFRVRDGNGWTLTAINTNLLFLERKSKQKELCAGSLATSVGHNHFENLFGIFCAILTNGTLSSQRPAIRSVFYLASSSRNRFESLHPQNRTKRTKWMGTSACIFLYSNLSQSGQALGILVPVSCIHYCTSTSGLSTT